VIPLRCGDSRYQAVLRAGQGGLEVTVDGQVFHPRVEALAPGVFVLRDGLGARVFHCVRDGERIHLAWQGRVYTLDEEIEGAGAAQRHHAGGLEAPMPGKVIKVAVEVGQQVAKGQELLVVEAMKMENALRAPKDGRVKGLAARVGDMVSPGVVLVEIE
jgi:3-methylcrotonyl-CoA carboxylase alpha subunit